MNIKKLLLRGGVGLGTLGIIVAGAAAFSAFEAHVVNVTATINNALTVPVEQNGLTFGNVFPEQVAHVTLPISLSDTFLKESRVDDVEYIIRQKPKCGIPVPETNPQQYSGFTQVGENTDGFFVCPQGSVQLPLLCPYLSKNELDVTGKPTGNGIPAFHGLPGPWKLSTTIDTQVAGVLSKESGKTSTSWDIDLHTPCFAGQCSQDWPKFVHDTNASVTDPTLYEADIKDEHQMFGCDLWVEITNISLPAGNGSLTVTKIVDNTGGGTKQVSDFPLFVDGASVTSGVATSTSVGTHQVTETSDPNYTAAFSGNCTSTGLVSVTTSTPASCVLINTFKATTTLTVNKVVDPSNDTGKFNLLIDDGTQATDVSNGGTTGAVTVSTGAHTVSEAAGTGTSLANYTAVISGDCASDGSITLSLGQHAVCTITNTLKGGHLTVNKVLVPSNDPGLFNLQIGGVTQGTGANVGNGGTTGSIPEAVGAYTVGETAGTNTSLADYTTVIGGDCAADGSVSIASNDNKVCTITNTRKTGSITVTKIVNNIHGGNNIVSDFKLFVSDLNGSTQVTSGATNQFNTGSYFINEQGVSGYQASFSGDCNSSGILVLTSGQNAQCTITNTDLPANITLIKAVDSGTAAPTSFSLEIDGGFVPQNSSVAVTSNTSHSINEAPKTGYHFVSITGDALCPAVLGGTVTLNEGQSITCTIHNAATP